MNTLGKILVVDDHVELAENLAEILVGAGYEAVIADSAEAALVRLGAGDVGAVITDFRLPGQSGADLITAMRRSGSDVPAVVMSAYTDPRTVQVSEEAGAIGVLPKPLDLAAFMKLVASLGAAQTEVLLIDDNRELADDLAEALRARGIQVVVGTNVNEALAHRERPRAAIVDLRLPDGSGLDVVRRLAARAPRVRVLFISAYCDDELKQRISREMPHVSYLDKPLDVQSLIGWVSKALGDAKTDRTHR